MAQTQMVYAKAIEQGKMDYSWFRNEEFIDRSQLKTIKELMDYLMKANKKWVDVIRKRREDEDFKIKWPGANLNLPNHITALISHERLHHGQIISYSTLAGFILPKGFKSNWAL
ncbi:hypothetical protein HYW42_01245 [Candidatus Daviesbacteria bacterium]|nr:hypothetical protein [Candidatus Daviesbacteria bacterium]